MSQDEKPPLILSQNLFPVVGVGASAGGLEAFRELVKAIPEDSGMAYILVQHLAPQHESMLTQILQKETAVPVVEVTDNIKVAPDHIYIIPSNRLLTANDGILQLEPLVKGEKLNTIDVFFTTLAEVHQQYAIGVVLSGTGSDGTIGLKTIKDQGGITFAQDEASATYFAMPKSAMDADVVDYVLSPQEIPRQLKELARSANLIPSDFTVPEDLKEEATFRQVLHLLRAKKGVDFTYYKQSTIRRRILRRKALNRIETLKAYQEHLFENKGEQDALFRDILIPVTAFFRDTKVFAALCETVFPSLFKEKTSSEPIRIWIAGCSTGEEAYSMAICVHEYFGDKAHAGTIQIFATDLSEIAIAKARSGIYDKRDMAGISESRLKQFFTKLDGSYQVAKAIREMCVFACHNFLKDPPFVKMDLISCRNVLIYMEPFLQKKAFATFHYALNNNGLLFLGRSESLGSLSQQFHPLNGQDKFYKRNALAGKYMPATTESVETALKRKDDSFKTGEGKKDDFKKAADDALLAKYATVGVVVNEQFDIIQFRGATGMYLEAPPGNATHALLKMAREGLSFELRNALYKAKANNTAVRKEGISMGLGRQKADIEVIPLQKTIEPYFLVLFSESQQGKEAVLLKGKRKKSPEEETSSKVWTERIEQLEKELALAREDMRAITETQEAANEELQSANEELLSGSEELQTLNEELESSKEEIQSSNEELTILNQELIERNDQLIHSRKYAEAIVSTIHEPLLVLTKELRIKSANKSLYQTFQATEKELEGKPFFEWQNGVWDIAVLREQLESILPNHSNFEGVVVTVMMPHNNERVMELNARQIINESSNEQLILLALQDITERHLLEQTQAHFAQQLEQKVREQTTELVEANTALRYSNENLQQFASIASHDLQEPLRKIKTFTAMFAKNFAAGIPEGGMELIHKINRSSARMSQLIKEVLEYSKVTHGNQAFVQTDLDLILRTVLADLDLLILETGAVIHYKQALPVVDAIPLQMNQLFYNLLTNALKFRKEETSPLIAISLRALSGDEIRSDSNLQTNLRYIEIIISDSGLGFEQQFAKQIFQLFERLYSADEFEGTGVGLALCKKIVENHQGHIFAKSTEGEGAAFYVVLPVTR
jgi:two-component system CheB/CheR fusion protein